MLLTDGQIILIVIGSAIVGAFIAHVIGLFTFEKRKDEFILRASLTIASGLVRKDIEDKIDTLTNFKKEYTCPKCGERLDVDANAICVDKQNSIWKVTCTHCGAEKIIDTPKAIEQNTKLK